MNSSIIRYVFFILLSLVFINSCENKVSSEEILRQAQDSMNNDKFSESLDLLNSIKDPQLMKHGLYMEYVVDLAYTKRQLDLSIKNDELITTAQDYFSSLNNSKQAGIANFIAGWYFYENDDLGKSINSFMQAEIFASRANDDVLAGRSANNVGFLYYDQVVLDSAIVYFRRSIGYYQKAKIDDELMLKVVLNIGQTYAEQDKGFVAYDYFQRGLARAIALKDTDYEMKFKNNIGVFFLAQEDYKQAKTYFFEIQPIATTSSDLSKIYLNLARVYSKEAQISLPDQNVIFSDSAKYYADLVADRIPQTSDKYLLTSIYQSLWWYYKYVGDYEQALHYADLNTDVVKRIDSENQAQKIHETTMRVHLQQKEAEIQKTELRSDYYIVGGIFVFLLLLFTSILIVKGMRKSYVDTLNDVEVLKTKYHHRVENMLLLQNTYFNTLINLIDRNNVGNKGNDMQQLSMQQLREKSADSIHSKQMILDLKKRTHDQLADWAKDFLLKNSSIQKILDKLNDEDILFLALCGCKYTENEIIAILDTSQEMLYLRKLELRNLFETNDFSEMEIDKLLFIENNRIQKY